MRLPRLHKSTIVVAAFAVAIAVLLEVPGRVTSGVMGIGEFNVFEHGWPWVYCRREAFFEGHDIDVPPARLTQWQVQSFVSPTFDTRADLPMWSIPWLRAANWRLWQHVDVGSVPHWELNRGRLLADTAIALAVVAAAIAAAEFRRRRRPHFLAFRLSDMLFAVTLLSIALGWCVYMRREHQREQQLAAKAMEDKTNAWSPFGHTCVAPLWFRSLCGDRLVPAYFWRTSEVYIGAIRYLDFEYSICQVAQLKYVTRVTVDGRSAGAYAALHRLKNVDTVYQVRDKYPAYLRVNEIEKLTQLRKLVLVGKNNFQHELLLRVEAALPNCKIIDESEEW